MNEHHYRYYVWLFTCVGRSSSVIRVVSTGLL